MSCSSRSLLLWTIWLIANGAAGRSGWARSCAASVSVISASHSSSCSAGRAFSAGIEPTMPALHCAMTSLGLLMMNSGAPMIGRGRLRRTAGSGMQAFLAQAASAVGQNASSASAVTLSAPSTIASRMPGRAAQQVLGVEARGGDLGLRGSRRRPRPRRAAARRRAARAPSASRRPGCRRASGRAPSRRTPRSGWPCPRATTKSTTCSKASRAAPQALLHRARGGALALAARSASVAAICAAIALGGAAAVARGLAADQVVGLDRRRAFVDRQDPRVAQVLRGAGLLDEAHAAVHLHAEARDLDAHLGAVALDQRHHELVEGLVLLARLGVGVRGARRRTPPRRPAPSRGSLRCRRASSSACAARRGGG